jgi:hypothetical protein
VLSDLKPGVGGFGWVSVADHERVYPVFEFIAVGVTKLEGSDFAHQRRRDDGCQILRQSEGGSNGICGARDCGALEPFRRRRQV